MSKICDVCGKQPMFGKSVARLGKGAMIRRVKARTPRRFNPNIQPVRAIIKGTPTRMKVCTSCIKAGKVQRVVG
ncbi:50S ribosomal protein L28 [Kribbella albertanoniae]|uniref:Large ribosomal subunit protein bL28 n=1 Tax=Kribbella albertanoniae TaxID=1266829 RepID=A0A4R4PQC8_9ACTN|nr:50S ribosomal protein L28 [Kribbella albertanoniae]TDC24394.1 50S ribosomal protein L28 [Kribbella albertanoniae]